MILIREVQRVVARHYGMSPAELISDDRCKMFAHPRQVAMYLARELSGHSLTVIGHWFHRDHSTIIHGIRSVEKRAARQVGLRRDIQKLRKRLETE
jgi:chromosomal replication initiator protein